MKATYRAHDRGFHLLSISHRPKPPMGGRVNNPAQFQTQIAGENQAAFGMLPVDLSLEQRTWIAEMESFDRF